MKATINCGGKEVAHNAVPWRLVTNRHPSTDGSLWGWIEGAPGNVCWAESEEFNRRKASNVVVEHNRWLEEQKPIDLRIIEATELAKAAHRKAEEKRREADKCDALHEAALIEVKRLEAQQVIDNG